jgi:hypothetical protein
MLEVTNGKDIVNKNEASERSPPARDTFEMSVRASRLDVNRCQPRC